MKDRNTPLKPCICGRQKATSFYGNSAIAQKMSPDIADVKVGITLAVIILIIAGLYSPYAAGGIIAIFVGIAIILMAIRVVKRHKIKCAFRWSLIGIVGIGGWF